VESEGRQVKLVFEIKKSPFEKFGYAECKTNKFPKQLIAKGDSRKVWKR
jgi:hypothetical protein